MKRFQVIIMPEALRNIDDIFHYIAADNPKAASKITHEFRTRIRSLATMPRRHPLAPENGILGPEEIRNLTHGKYRIIYAIYDKTVTILEIRHTARLPLII